MKKDFILASLLSLLIFLPASTSRRAPKPSVGYPVIFIPGDGGSQIQAKLNRSFAPHIFCEKFTSNFFDIWLNLELLFPYILECFVDEFSLQFDNVTHTTRDADGVSIRVPGFGDTKTVEYLDSSEISPTLYFGNIIKTLVSSGYKRNVSVRGAPFDFRKAANEHKEFFVKLKSLTEETYKINDRKPVIFVCHSMGNVMFQYFLQNKVSPNWIAKYVKTMIAISAPWAGAAKALRLEASGDNLGTFVVNQQTIRPLQRSLVSSAWLMPNRQVWDPKEVLVQTSKRNYTINDYKRFFYDIGFMDGYLMWRATKDLLGKLEPPPVSIHCLHGINQPTPERFIYSGATFPDTQPITVNGPGDGTVNLRSLQLCLQWKKKGHPVVYRTFDRAEHVHMLWRQDVADYVLKVASGEGEPDVNNMTNEIDIGLKFT